jgi:hypothetical protein
MRRVYDHKHTLPQQFFGVACKRSKQGCQKKNKKQKTKLKSPRGVTLPQKRRQTSAAEKR